MNNKRGYYGIVFYQPKFEENIGTAFRNAHCFDADFIGIIERRYTKECTDTSFAQKHVPLYEYKNLEDFLSHTPVDCKIISVEIDGNDIKNFVHPERAIYLIGGEDRTLPIIKGVSRVRFPTKYCVNMAVASALILYDRIIKI